MSSYLSAVRPKEPINSAWVNKGSIPSAFANVAYYHPRLRLLAVSAVEVPEGVPEYHLTISKRGKYSGKRCSKQEAELVVKQFGMEGALEDNHSPVIRSYWMPVQESEIGNECDCKDEETAIVEGDFEWRPLTNENANRHK